MSGTMKWVVGIAVLLVVLGGGYYLLGTKAMNDPEVAQTGEPLEGVPTAQPITEEDGSSTFSMHIDELEGQVDTLEYTCADEQTFMVRMEVGEGSDEVEVFLNDGSKMLLSQTISASGIRFANAGESFIFWSKGNTAFIEEDEAPVYEDCMLVEGE